jgi:hypothetical protein
MTVWYVASAPAGAGAAALAVNVNSIPMTPITATAVKIFFVLLDVIALLNFCMIFSSFLIFI